MTVGFSDPQRSRVVILMLASTDFQIVCEGSLLDEV
jgi:hypothetical protein